MNKKGKRKERERWGMIYSWRKGGCLRRKEDIWCGKGSIWYLILMMTDDEGEEKNAGDSWWGLTRKVAYAYEVWTTNHKSWRWLVVFVSLLFFRFALSSYTIFSFTFFTTSSELNYVNICLFVNFQRKTFWCSRYGHLIFPYTVLIFHVHKYFTKS